ncbi:hypothetical protein CLOM_g7370 [Closterium sp. NIES-68]|nr:hypothetical protein CLOM_g7370 [Closterium sp. NIES-68]GJP77053.1 hypothetical protein CLOP_g7486 [Closterium sp. NIES-67]GJP87001.1 hypothetical protein CLOP_g16973 [Closterium sp. NIES-67]
MDFYACQFCNKRFRGPAEVSNHERSHRNDAFPEPHPRDILVQQYEGVLWDPPTAENSAAADAEAPELQEEDLEGEDIGGEEGLVGEKGLADQQAIEEDEFVPAAAYFAEEDDEVSSFDTRFETSRFLTQCNRGVGLCGPDVDAFLRLVNHPGFVKYDLGDWKRKGAVEKYMRRRNWALRKLSSRPRRSK